MENTQYNILCMKHSTYACLIWCVCAHASSLRNSNAKYIGNKLPRQCQNFYVRLWNTSAKKMQESAETFCQELWFHFWTISVGWKTLNQNFKSTRKRKKEENCKWMNLKYFCSKLRFWCVCISHICNLLCNIILNKYK